jgi:hypothetical protein
MHEMRLAEADAAVQEKRIEGHRLGFRNAARGSECKLVRFSDDKIFECVAWIEGRPHVVVGAFVFYGGGGYRTRLCVAGNSGRERVRRSPYCDSTQSRMNRVGADSITLPFENPHNVSGLSQLR